MQPLAPGNILQFLYLKDRFRSVGRGKSFCEIGAGEGYLSSVLLNLGMIGVGYDLNLNACEKNRKLNSRFIAEDKYRVESIDFMTTSILTRFDYVLASMVIEHMTDSALDKFINKCKSILVDQGKIIFFVPGSMKYWGIEDEIAGHIKRYEFHDFQNLAQRHGLKIVDLAGLTYPLSNWLFRISNFLVRRAESHKLKLSQQERTVLSSNREVSFKTHFPWWTVLVLNPVVLYPFHLLQKLNKQNHKSLVLYCELTNK